MSDARVRLWHEAELARLRVDLERHRALVSALDAYTKEPTAERWADVVIARFTMGDGGMTALDAGEREGSTRG